MPHSIKITNVLLQIEKFTSVLVSFFMSLPFHFSNFFPLLHQLSLSYALFGSFHSICSTTAYFTLHFFTNFYHCFYTTNYTDLSSTATDNIHKSTANNSSSGLHVFDDLV